MGNFKILQGNLVPNNIIIYESFDNLSQWQPVYFPKIKKHTHYRVSTMNNITFLQANGTGSASAISHHQEFNVYDFPKLKWRWKIDNVLKKGDATSKRGDDFPIRIYISFPYQPEKADIFESAKYESARLLLGKYPPHSALGYIWANKKQSKNLLRSPYSNRSMMIIKQWGAAKKGEWIEEEADLVSDYIKAFNKKPPKKATLTIMSDTDNTGESAVSYLDYIHVYKTSE